MKTIGETTPVVGGTGKSLQLSNVIRLLAWGFGLLYVFSRLIPCHPIGDYAVSVPIDNAWGQIMHVAFEQKMQFGRDIVFTYGPWGFLARGYYPPTYFLSVVAWLALSSVFIGAGWRMTRYFTNNQIVSWLWLIGFTALVSIPAGNDLNNLLSAWGILLLFLHFVIEEGAFSPLQALLVFTLGWLGLVKFTGFMEGALLVAVIALDTIVRHRRFPWIIPVWLAGILSFWLLACQQLRWFWPFLKHSWAVAGGYSDAMNDGDLFILAPLAYIVIGAGFCGLMGMLIEPRSGVRGPLFLSGMCWILFLSFKQGYVRNDDVHEIAAVITLMLTGLACMAVAAKREKKLKILAVGMFCASSLFAALSIGLNDPSGSFCRQLAQTFTPYNLLAPVASLTTRTLEVDYGKSQSLMKEGIPLPPVQGGADLYPYSQDVLFANGVGYCPRPVIQSYSAFTPELARMNAQWLQTDRAAKTLFFAINDPDNRFPSLDDGFSWPELLTLYDLKGISSESGAYLCLSRSPTPRKFQLQPFLETNVTLGETFNLPSTANGPVWAEIEISKTLTGKLLSFFFKPTILMADIKLANKSEKIRRIVPGLASAGFLLSPYIASNEAFLALAKADSVWLSGKMLLNMRLFESEESNSSFCYQPLVNIRFYRLDFPPQDIHFQVPETTPSDRTLISSGE